MNTNSANGVLAIWHDCAPNALATFEDWYQTEHLPERLSVAGFARGRRFEAVFGAPNYLTCYDVESPGVLRSDAYLTRLANPTTKTHEVMSNIFMNVNRTVCRRQNVFGSQSGAYILTARFSEQRDSIDLENTLVEFNDPVTVACANLWIADEDDGSGLTKEEALRGADAKIAACVTLEFLREESAKAAAETARNAFANADIGVYKFLCELRCTV